MTNLITAKEVKRILGVSMALVYKMADEGRLPCVRIPCPSDKNSKKPRTLVRFKPEDVQTFIEEHYG